MPILGNLSCCEVFFVQSEELNCSRSSISNLNCTLLYASSRSTAMARVCSFLWNTSQTSYANLAAFSPVVCLALHRPWFVLSTFFLSKSGASFLATTRSISFPVAFFIVRIRYPFSLL